MKHHFIKNNFLLFSKYFFRTVSGYCPNCGDIRLFLTRFKMKDKCEGCGIYFIEKNGDNWFFLLLIDRALFIFPIIVAFYFQFSPYMIIILSIVLLLIFIIATPFRISICLALDYYFRSKIN